MHEKLLGLGRMHKNQTQFFFKNESLFLNVWIFFEVLEKNRYF
jgi:hypothetical protein